MNIDTMLDTANDLMNHAGPAVKSSAKDALHSMERGAKNGAKTLADEVASTAEHAKDAVVHEAREARKVMRSRIFKTYDLAVSLAPFLLPERAARVKSRRIAYVAFGGVLLGAAGIAALELAKPGTLGGFAKRIKTLFASGAAEVKSEAEHVLHTVKETSMQAKQQVERMVGDAKRGADHASDGVTGGASHGGKDGKTS